ncbi:MAG: cupin domain-containing protein [Candidatus Micrarchaeota archaeon]
MKKTNVGKVLKKLKPRLFERNGKIAYAYDKAIIFNEGEIGVKGAKYQIVSFPRGASIEPHCHKRVREIFLIASGSGIVKINKKSHMATAGDVFLIQPGDFHSLKNAGKAPFVLHIFKWNENPKDVYWQ